MPEVNGHVKVFLGDDVTIFGKIGIYSARVYDEPKLIIKNHVGIGHGVNFVVNKEIIVEEDVHMATGVRVMDSDAHPRDTDERIAGLPPSPEDIKPVRIGRGSWIGQNTFIMKGVTIGEGAVVGVNSVVINDIPPFVTAMGNPARVVSPPWPGKNKTANTSADTSTKPAAPSPVNVNASA
jgi:acetyltransferase-like isoleucine patch superfamily enzyme